MLELQIQQQRRDLRLNASGPYCIYRDKHIRGALLNGLGEHTRFDGEDRRLERNACEYRLAQ